MLPKIVVLPFHGRLKISREGYRTRDAHVVKELTKLGYALEVVSRPEPFPRLTLAGIRPSSSTGRNDLVRWIDREVLSFPPVRDRQAWWARSSAYYDDLPPGDVLLSFHPFLPDEVQDWKTSGRRVAFDLLDDLTVHPQFSGVGDAVTTAYERTLSIADTVSCNSLHTAALVTRISHHDPIVVHNGWTSQSSPLIDGRTGTRQRVGYGGKLTSRFDVETFEAVARKLPHVQFVVCGQPIDSVVVSRLRKSRHVKYLGDLPYTQYIDEVRRWDCALVPHIDGQGFVGGDLIKIYEYRALGLPVVAYRNREINPSVSGVFFAEPASLDVVVADVLDQYGRPGGNRMEWLDAGQHSWRQRVDSLITAHDLAER